MTGKHVIEVNQPSKIQQKLNQWRHMYDVKILHVSPPALVDGEYIITMCIQLGEKSEN